MRGSRIVQLDLDGIASECAIPAGFVADADRYYEIVDMRNDAGDFFTVGQSDGGGRRLEIWIEHVRFEFDGGIFFGDASKIAVGRVAILAAAGTFEEGFAFFEAAGEEFFDGVSRGYAGGLQRFFGARVEVCGDVCDLIFGSGQWGHAFVRAAVFDDFADEVAIDVVGENCGADEVGAAGAGGVGTMAEAAGLRELFLSSRGRFSGSLLGVRLLRMGA